MTLKRVRVRCSGAVQGVGFRPTVHRLATELGLTGRVLNDPEGATAEVEGSYATVQAFVDRLPTEMPPLARLDAMDVEDVDVLGDTAFSVEDSVHGQRSGALVPPDAALCTDCRSDMEDASDRRWHYPFTTCTNCGPRYSLVHNLPYDRARTAMGCFPFCPDCEREYRDPSDRRFHAEPVCCPACGPDLWLSDRTGERLATADAAVERVRHELLAGAVVAVKGLGGFQLACRADRSAAVGELRRRKHRPSKPFAVMVRDLEAARSLVRLNEADERLLLSPRSPVVLAPRRESQAVAETVAPALADLGVMVPTTPLHVELFRPAEMPALVMTSANVSDEPICKGNREAVERLVDLADFFLLHDRDVVRRVDDSVWRSAETGPFAVRRARGWVPEPLPLEMAAAEPMAAVGAHLQVTGCVAAGANAFPTQHVGDMDGESARAFLEEAIAGMEEFLEVRPTTVVCDCHPDYPSTWLARRLVETRSGRLIEVQHHLAHAAAVLGEHRRFPQPETSAVAVILDGTGWGPDHTAWGGEWLRIFGDLTWQRVAHLQELPLVGGERAVREPWRVAVAALISAGCPELVVETPMARLVDSTQLDGVAALASSPSWPRATGAGRVFEACGALLGLVVDNRWEGEAAACLEAAASEVGTVKAWSEVSLSSASGVPVLPTASLLAAAARRSATGENTASVAAGFHRTFTHLVAQLTKQLCTSADQVVALGGGCFVNRILRAQLQDDFADLDMEALLPVTLPAGDGGLSFGQVVLAAAAMHRGVDLDRLQRPEG